MEEKTVYIKPEQCSVVTHCKILLEDVAKVYCQDDKLAKEVGALEVLTVTKKEEMQKKSVSVLRLIRLISDCRPGIAVVNLGESDIVVEYQPPKPRKKLLEAVKVAAVSLIIFAGSAFTIMTFNNDASVKEVFSGFYQMMTGSAEGNGWLEVSYSLGLPLGIILFFNHFAAAKFSSDPTPLQIQMRLYEQNEATTIIENASRSQEKLEK